MIKRAIWLSLALLLLLPPAATLAQPASPAFTVWTVGTATKVQPTSAPGPGQAVTLAGARASYDAFQVVVKAGAAGLTGVNLAASDLADGLGHVLPAANLTLFREAYINFSGVSAAGGTLPVPARSPTGDGRIPDPLIPLVDPYTGLAAGAPFNVAANENQPVWLDVSIPATAAAGVYTGSLTVTAAGQGPVHVPVSLTVWDLTLPDMTGITTHFKLSLNDLLQYHSGIAQCSPPGSQNCWLDWNARSRTIVKRYQELAHTHRIDVGQYFVTGPNYQGYSASNCPLLPIDWTAYDAALQPYMDGSYWSDSAPSSRLEVPFSPGATWGLEAECTQAQYTALAAAWAAHLRAKGWFSRAVVYAADEPDPSQYPAIAQNAQWLIDGDPGWKTHIMDTTAPQASNVGMLNPALGIYTVALAWYDHWWWGKPTYGRAPGEWPSLFAQGIRLWFYESNAQGAPYPTYATNTLIGSEPRIMAWGAWYEGASGFLMWDTTDWDPSNPWGPNTQFGKTGDGVTIYPGNHDGLSAGKAAPANGSPAGVAIDGPVPSYRLKMIRAGLQDWALFDLAQQFGLADYARAQVATAYSQLGGSAPINGSWYWKWDDATLAQARQNVAQAIIAARARLTHAEYLPLAER